MGFGTGKIDAYDWEQACSAIKAGTPASTYRDEVVAAINCLGLAKVYAIADKYGVRNKINQYVPSVKNFNNSMGCTTPVEQWSHNQAKKYGF